MMSASLIVLFTHFYGRAFLHSPTPQTGGSLAREAGLSAEVLAAAGCTGEQAQAIAADILANTNGREARALALANLNSVVHQLSVVQAQLSKRPRDQELFRQRAMLTQARVSATQSLADAEHALRTHSGLGLQEGVAAKIETGALSRGHMLTAPIRVSMPSDTNWTLLSSAVRAQQRSTRMGTAVPARYQSMVQALSANTSIGTATERIQTNLAGVRTALSATIDQAPPPPPPPPPHDGPP